MEAANCSLRVKRPLLDPRFEGYKLSLEPLPCYQLELDAAVAEVKLRDDQYTLEHMHAFGMYNYLHCDAWYQDSVYYIDNLGRIMNLTVMLFLPVQLDDGYCGHRNTCGHRVKA
uniref:NudC domain-containing protein 1 n=1 Tax=Cricetulus griseus TaxID=10029 RepID=A0A8C2MBU7_CRIGR